MTVDLDGVICAPPFALNLGIRRRSLDPDAPPRRARVPPRWLGAPIDHLRFDLRRPAREAHEALSSLGERRRLVLLTGRRTAPEGWLRRHGLRGHFERVVINETADASPHFKLACVRALGASEHVDDDARTAQLLAERSEARVFLRNWPRNRGLPYAPSVVRVADLTDVARRVHDEDAEGAAGAPD